MQSKYPSTNVSNWFGHYQGFCLGQACHGFDVLSQKIVHTNVAVRTYDTNGARCTVYRAAGRAELESRQQYKGEIAFKYDRILFDSRLYKDLPLYAVFKPYFVVVFTVY